MFCNEIQFVGQEEKLQKLHKVYSFAKHGKEGSKYPEYISQNGEWILLDASVCQH